jgi:uncharacterized membrane protein
MTDSPARRGRMVAEMTQTPVRIAQLANLLLFALVVGVFWGTWFSLSRSIASITPQGFLEIGHTMIANLGMPMSLLMPAALLSSVPVLFGLFRQRRFGAFYLALAGLLLLVAALGITLSVNVPIDAEINQWRIDTLPLNWTTIRDRWQFYHTIRTFVSLAGLGCAIASVVWAADTDAAGE